MSVPSTYYIRTQYPLVPSRIDQLRSSIVAVDASIEYNRISLERKLTHVINALFVTYLDVEAFHMRSTFEPDVRFTLSSDIPVSLEEFDLERYVRGVSKSVIITEEEMEGQSVLTDDFYDAFDIYLDYLSPMVNNRSGKTLGEGIEEGFDILIKDITDLLIGDSDQFAITKIEYCPFSDGECFKVKIEGEPKCSAPKI